MKKFLLIVVLFLAAPLIISAKSTKINKFLITCDKDKYNIGDQAVCRVSTNTDFDFNTINFKISLTEGLSIEDVRSNYEAVWKVTKTKELVTFSTKREDIKTGLQEFGIVLININKSGVTSVNLSDIELLNTTDSTTQNFSDITSEVKVISTNNNLNSITIDNKKISNFNTNLQNYYINIESQTSLNIEAEPANEFAKLSGIGEIKLSENIKDFVIPIIVTSESGNNKIYNIFLTRTTLTSNDIDKTLSASVLKNNLNQDIIFNFNKDITEYYIQVEYNITSIDINPTLTNEDTSFVKGYGKQNIKLSYGDNIAIIKVKDKEGQIKNYVFNITKELSNRSANNYLKNITITGYKMNFNKKVKNYKLAINKNTTKLDIEAKTENKNATYLIEGNKNLQEGSIIKIIVTAENAAKTIYRITITYKSINYYFIFIPILGVLGLGYLIIKNQAKIKNKITKKRVAKIITTNKPVPEKNKKLVITKEHVKKQAAIKQTEKAEAKELLQNKNASSPKKSNNKSKYYYKNGRKYYKKKKKNKNKNGKK